MTTVYHWVYTKESLPAKSGRYLAAVEYTPGKRKKIATIEIVEYFVASHINDRNHFIISELENESIVYADENDGKPYRIVWWSHLPDMPAMTSDDDDLEAEEGLDEDGYPTEYTLNVIRNWPIRTDEDLAAIMSYIKQIWYCPNRMTNEGLHYTLVTSGWSGNEDIIGAMRDNVMLHILYWYTSRRGGHHEYKPLNYKG